MLIFQGITSPAEPFFWPEALLPKTSRDKETDEPLEHLQAGYSGYVDDDWNDDDDDLDEEDGQEEMSVFTVSIQLRL